MLDLSWKKKKILKKTEELRNRISGRLVEIQGDEATSWEQG